MELSIPVTIIECPPLKVFSVRFYVNTPYGKTVLSEVVAEKCDKELSRKLCVPKKITKKIDDIKDYDDLTLVCYTQPKLLGIGKKKPDVFEIGLAGKKEEKLALAKEKLGKEINIQDIFKEGEQIDIHAVTKGKGFQGPVKRFGVALKQHKTEKGVRSVGSLGAWCGQGGIMYRVAHAGQMGYHTRTEFNKWILKISTNPKDINQKSGFKHYGFVKNPYIIVKGSIAGPAKRIVRINAAMRPNHKVPKEAPHILEVVA
jgi:large subunit ribosomal protein L3